MPPGMVVERVIVRLDRGTTRERRALVALLTPFPAAHALPRTLNRLKVVEVHFNFSEEVDHDRVQSIPYRTLLLLVHSTCPTIIVLVVYTVREYASTSTVV